MAADVPQISSHDCNSHVHPQLRHPQEFIHFNSGNNSNTSGIQINGKINIDHNKICNVHCSCRNWRFAPDGVQFEFSDIEESGKCIPGVENDVPKQNSGLIEGQQFFNFNTGNNRNKSGTQISGSINFHFLQVYYVYYSCPKLKDMLDKAKSEFTDIESVRQISEAENIILLKKSGIFSGKQMFCFNTGNNHNESGTQKSGIINFRFKQVHNTYYSCHNSKNIVGEAEFDIQTDTEKLIPEVENVMLEDKTDISGGQHFFSFNTGNNYNVSGKQTSGGINFCFKQKRLQRGTVKTSTKSRLYVCQLMMHRECGLHLIGAGSGVGYQIHFSPCIKSRHRPVQP